MDNRVTKDRIDTLLDGCTFHFSKLYGTTTACQVVMSNGFTLALGTSACVDPSNYDYELGKVYAKEDALEKASGKLWELEGYMLAMKLNPI